jgi:hypothetical protein
MYNSADIIHDSFGIDSISLSQKAVVLYNAESVELKQEVKHGNGFYHIISSAGKVFERMIEKCLSYKIARAAV